jgi:uncharacterized circularly permuted ATP-grasp superfamily protein/uncharacterized alpha-E superfamily protein
MVDGKGGLRTHWRSLLGTFSALGEGGLAERAQRLNRAFEEEGVTSVLPGATAMEHAWRCDPVPLPITAAEFGDLEAGLAQRATLLDALLADLYGPQKLLADGHIPPALVYNNPSFLRSCRNIDTPSHMQFYAADLVRGPDGGWRVLADRTSGAAGIGFARENRRLLTRVMPEAFRPMQVRQLRPFFDIWQDSLQKLALNRPGTGSRPSSPTVALLTPGTGAAQWFEHMYLSRELSCALVEGGDLTVRGGIVYLKTLRGLQQVDVLLRRVDGRMIDPLELDHGSLLGVSGLLDAARTGSVRISNDPGSGLAEAPALAAFLPALCMRLLEERLLLQSVPTMWMGEQRARAVVQQDPGKWLIRPATDGGSHGLSPATMLPADRAALMQKIEARPWEWAATASIPPSVAPCLDASGLTPRPIVMRLFLVHDGIRWQALQGGLARVLEHADQVAGRLPAGGLSKDVWVLNEERGDVVGPAPSSAPIMQIRRATGDLPSRVADNLFWLGRYVERLEHSARLIRAAIARLARGSGLNAREGVELHSLALCLVEAGCLPAELASGSASTNLLAEALLACVREGGMLHDRFNAVSRLTESVRDRLTGDMYATFTQALRAARADAAVVGRSLDGLSHAMVSIQRYSTSVAGVAAESMVRGGGWLFLDLGRRVERAHAVTGEIAIALDHSPERIETGLRLVLELCDSAITYRTRYLNVLQPAPVLDLVLADQGNPRGLAFQLVAIHGLLDELTEGSGREMLAGAAAGLLAEVEALVENVLEAKDQSVAAAQLPPNLLGIAGAISELSDRITRRYFALLPVAQTLGVGPEADEIADELPTELVGAE